MTDMTNMTVMSDEDIKQLKKQIEEYEQKLAEGLRMKRAEDLKKVKELCKRHGFTQTDLRTVLKTRKKAIPKY